MSRPDPRLLSHRCRGFDAAEGTMLGMRRALEKGVGHVEIDLRITRDQHLVVIHDPVAMVSPGIWRHVDELTLAEMRQVPALSSLATFDEMCRTFAANAGEDTLMHVDVKVAGFETEIRDVLSAHGLLERAVLVSWIPSVLSTFHALEPAIPLCFSHLTLTKAPWTLRAVQAFGGDGTISNLVRLMLRPLPHLARELSSVRLHVAANGDPHYEVRDDDRLRFNHGVVVPDMVSGGVLQQLKTTRGYVCVPVAMATRDIGERYRQLGIRLAVFSSKSTPQTLNLLERLKPDLVYVDAADVFDQIFSTEVAR